MLGAVRRVRAVERVWCVGGEDGLHAREGDGGEEVLVVVVLLLGMLRMGLVVILLELHVGQREALLAAPFVQHVVYAHNFAWCWGSHN